jgi:hypothetical protein
MRNFKIPFLEIVATTSLLAIAFTVLVLLFPSMRGQDVAAWVQAIGSIGAVLIAVGLFYAQHEKARELISAQDAQAIAREKEAERAEIRHLLRSLRDEISVVVEGFEKRNGKLLMEGKQGEAFWYQIPVPDRPFPVYESSVDRIGKIPNDELRRLIVIGYGRALGVVQSIRMNNIIVSKFEQADHWSNVYNDDVHGGLRLSALNAANTYGDTLREIYSEAKQGFIDLLGALQNEVEHA